LDINWEAEEAAAQEMDEGAQEMDEGAQEIDCTVCWVMSMMEDRYTKREEEAMCSGWWFQLLPGSFLGINLFGPWNFLASLAIM
jgi:hypothetical protein